MNQPDDYKDNVERIPLEVTHSLGNCPYCRTAIDFLSANYYDKSEVLHMAQHWEQMHSIALKQSNITEFFKEISGRA